MSDYGEFTPITVRSDTTPIERFPPSVWALAERVWAEMLTVKHPADEFQKLRDIEEIASCLVSERERNAKIAERTEPFNYFDRETDSNDIYTGNVTLVSARRPVYRDGHAIAKAIRGASPVPETAE